MVWPQFIALPIYRLGIQQRISIKGVEADKKHLNVKA